MPPRKADTPARVTRASSCTPGPLPAVDTRQSHAYGSRGKAALTNQVTTSQSAIDDAFAKSRDEGEMPPPPRPEPKKSAVRRGTPRPEADQTHDVAVNGVADPKPAEQSRPESASSHRPATGIDSTGYANGLSAQQPEPQPDTWPESRPPRRSPPQPRQSQTQTQPRRRRQPRPEEELQAQSPPPPVPEPHWLAIFIATACQFIGTKLFWILLAFSWLTCISYLISALVIVCGSLPPTADLNSTTERVCYHTGMIAGFDSHRLPKETADRQIGINKILYYGFQTTVQHVENFNTTLNELASQVGLLDEAVAEIQRALPSMMVVVEKDGQVVIPDPFWEALAHKMTSSESSASIWDGFLRTNQASLEAFVRGEVKTTVDGVVVEQKLVTGNQFEATLAENNRMMEEKFNETLRTMQTLVLQQAKITAQNAAKDVFESTHLGKGQVKALAYSNLLVNMVERMQHVNYLSDDHGAVVIAHYTSNTWRVPSLAQQLGRWVWSTVGMGRPHKPVKPRTTALTESYKSTDCWCADSPADAIVKLQMGVSMPYKIFPNSFTIEHMPATGTRDIASAPRNFEIWVKMDSQEQAKKVKRSIQDLDNPIWPGDCGNPPNSTSSRDNADAWVCAVIGEYDIHGHNYLQSFFFPSNPWDLGLEIQNVFLKVTSNWGADHTCLYQIRLTGDEVDYHKKLMED